MVRQGLIEAGVELARQAGPNAVVLREATRAVGVAPNAAYRHFEDRDALLGAVCTQAMRQLAERMDLARGSVTQRRGSKAGATGRFRATNAAYLHFALEETGLFDTAFAVPADIRYADDAAAAGPSGRTPFQLLNEALDELVEASILPAVRRPGIEYPVWAAVHGMAVLLTHGPLRQLAVTSTDALLGSLDQFILRGITGA
jgi:AcrR family transcriptional regulator